MEKEKKNETTIDKDKYKAKLNRITKAYINGDLDEADYQRMSNDIHTILNAVNPEPEKKNTKVKEILNMDIERTYNDLDAEHKRDFWRANIKAIYLSKRNKIDSIDFV